MTIVEQSKKNWSKKEEIRNNKSIRYKWWHQYLSTIVEKRLNPDPKSKKKCNNRYKWMCMCTEHCFRHFCCYMTFCRSITDSHKVCYYNMWAMISRPAATSSLFRLLWFNQCILSLEISHFMQKTTNWISQYPIIVQ